MAWECCRRTHALTHAVQLSRELRVILLHLDLSPCRLRVREGVNDLSGSSRQLGRSLEILECLGDLALLQEKLRHRSNSDIALRINYAY